MDSQLPLPVTDASASSTTIIATNATNSSSITPPPGPPNKAKSLSCGTCRERKVKCDKTQPCSTCQRAKVPCVFPSAKRLPRKRQGERKKTNEKLLQRLNRLEALVEKAGLDEKEALTVEKKGKIALDGSPQSPNGPSNGEVTQKKLSNFDIMQKKRERSETSLSSGSQPVGKSAIEGEMSRYLGSNFWANLSDEVEGLRIDLNESSDGKGEVEEDDIRGTGSPAKPAQAPRSPTNFIFSFNTSKVDLHPLHPTPAQIETMWSIYVQNVDPINRILHKPTLRKFLSGAKDNISSMPGGSKMQALMFAIYFAAITSLTHEECTLQIGEHKEELLARYRYGTEQALVQAQLLNSSEMVTLQALAIRIAHALDLHRDDSFASLSPFNTELRRRLWWQIIILDGRATEDRASDPMISEQSYNTIMPSNVNDEDIGPENAHITVGRDGYTEMTFCLICHEVSVTIRQLNYAPPGLAGSLAADSQLSQQEKEQLVMKCHERLEAKYLRYCDTTIPLSWATSMVTRMIMARMWLIVHQPLQRQEGGLAPQSVDHEKILLTATEVIEYAHVLETEKCAERWRWFFSTWHQWYALALALVELCHLTRGPVTDRAWKAVNSVFDSWATNVADSQSVTGLWRPIRILQKKARNARDGKSLGDMSMAEDPLAHFEGEMTTQPIPSSFGDPLSQTMFDFPIDSLETSAEGLLPSSDGAQGLLATPLPYQMDLSQWTVNDEHPLSSQGVTPAADQFNWASWDDFMRASQRGEACNGLWGSQRGTWWQ
ncbi:MAG: hypothetical protein LQ344_007992 [Seirophora lacunosa]|nr:MAG: hypothetical protein LQ344_007992 [Seirophora lacunosa]